MALLAAVSMTGLSIPHVALAAKQVYTPYVEQGELELEWKGGYVFDDEDDEDGEQANKFSIGYGVTDRWFTELATEVEKSGASGADYEFAALEWENRFQFFEPGEYWLDAGLYAAYETSLEDGDKADKTELKLLLGKSLPEFSHYANITLEKELGAHAEEGAEMEIAWSSRYRYRPWLEPGFEVYSAFGEMSGLHGYDAQSHQIGPVLYGDLPGGFSYEAGYLFGISEGAPDGEIIANSIYFRT